MWIAIDERFRQADPVAPVPAGHQFGPADSFHRTAGSRGYVVPQYPQETDVEIPAHHRLEAVELLDPMVGIGRHD